MTTPSRILYRARATSTGGGRDGRSVSSDNAVDLKLSTPRELGGAGGEGTNPEQLFAAGYSACFLGALRYVAAREKVALPESTSVTGEVGIGPVATGFGLDVALQISAPGLDRDVLLPLVEKAHAACPYSNATRGNIHVALAVV